MQVWLAIEQFAKPYDVKNISLLFRYNDKLEKTSVERKSYKNA